MENKHKKQHPISNPAPPPVKPIQGEFQYYKTVYWMAAIIVALTTFLVYLPALNNDFVNWDDGAYVYENNAIRSLDFGFFKWAFTSEVVGLWHPLTMFSFAVNYGIWEMDPRGYHLTNNVFHVFNTLLVFVLTIKLVKLINSNDALSNEALITGTVTALLFGIHPVHVESVAWVSERKDVLSAFFYLLSLLVYLKYVSTPNPKRKIFYSVCMTFFILALLSKPMAASLPVVLLILDFYPLGRLTFTNIKAMLVEKLPFFLLSLFVSSATLWAHYYRGGLPSSNIFPVVGRIYVAIHSYIFYLVKMVLPIDLAPFYPYPIEINYFGMEYLASLVLLGTITFLCIWPLRRNKLFSVIWLYYIVTLLPVIGIIKVGSQAAADRYTYLPSIGPFLLAGLGTAFIYEKYSKKSYRIAIIAAMLLVSSVLVNKTVKQIAVWHDSIALWSYQVKVFPGVSSIAYFELGEAYFEMRNYRQAIENFNIAIELNPKDADAYTNLGLAYFRLGDDRQALAEYKRAIEINPNRPIVYNNRGLVYDKLGDYQAAIIDYNKAIELNPRYGEAYDNRGGIYFTVGDYQPAVRDYNKAIELDPRYAKAYYNRGTVYNALGAYQEAIKDFSRAIELNPTDSMYYTNRGSAYNAVGNSEHAIKDYNKAIELNPKDAYAYYNLGNVYSQTGDIEQAMVSYRKAAAMGLKEAQDILANIMKEPNR